MPCVTCAEMQTTGKISKEILDMIAKFFKHLQQKHNEMARIGAAEAMGTYVKNYGELCMMSLEDVSADVVASFERYANEAHLFLVKTPVKGQYLCATQHMDACNKCEYDALVNVGRYFQEAPMSALDRINQEGFVIKGLDIYEEEVLKNKLNAHGTSMTAYTEEDRTRITKLFDVRDDSILKQFDDDTLYKRNLAVKTSNVYKSFGDDSQSHDLCRAVLDATFSLVGENKVKEINYDLEVDLGVNEAIKNAIEIRTKDEAARGNFTPTYIHNASASGKDKYLIELGLDEMVVYKYVGGQKMSLLDEHGQKMRCGYDEPDFPYFKQKWLDVLENKELTTSEPEAIKTIQEWLNPSGTTESVAYAFHNRTVDEKMRSAYTKEVCSLMDRAAQERIDHINSTAGLSSAEAYKEYVHTCETLIDVMSRTNLSDAEKAQKISAELACDDIDMDPGFNAKLFLNDVNRLTTGLDKRIYAFSLSENDALKKCGETFFADYGSKLIAQMDRFTDTEERVPERKHFRDTDYRKDINKITMKLPLERGRNNEEERER